LRKETTKMIIRISVKVILCVILLLTFQQVVRAGSFESTKLVTGTKSLAEAIISWLTGIGITICGGYFIYYVYCLKTNDEGERRRNIQNIKTTLISMVLITCGLALIDVILGFYK
jgi:Mn2+/Fe2+ NRAMP family transporter